jgi:IclR family pca regulon transcriptional regulator
MESAALRTDGEELSDAAAPSRRKTVQLAKLGPFAGRLPHTRKISEPPAHGSSTYSLSLEKGLAIFAYLAEQPFPRQIKEVAEALELTNSSTFRYMQTLRALGIVEQVADRRYRLTIAVTDFATKAINAITLGAAARPALGHLHEQSDQTATLASLDGLSTVVVAYAPAKSTPSRPATGGLFSAQSVFPAHSSASGKMLLGHLPPEEREKLLSGPLEKVGPRTITCPSALGRSVRDATGGPLAISYEELGPRLIGIAAPIRDRRGHVVAAVELSAHRRTVSLERSHGWPSRSVPAPRTSPRPSVTPRCRRQPIGKARDATSSQSSPPGASNPPRRSGSERGTTPTRVERAWMADPAPHCRDCGGHNYLSRGGNAWSRSCTLSTPTSPGNRPARSGTRSCTTRWWRTPGSASASTSAAGAAATRIATRCPSTFGTSSPTPSLRQPSTMSPASYSRIAVAYPLSIPTIASSGCEARCSKPPV